MITAAIIAALAILVIGWSVLKMASDDDPQEYPDPWREDR